MAEPKLIVWLKSSFGLNCDSVILSPCKLFRRLSGTIKFASWSWSWQKDFLLRDLGKVPVSALSCCVAFQIKKNL